MLGYIMRKGNTTVYEWRTGSAPTKIERPKQVAHSFGDEDEQKKSNDDDKIDFGDLDTGSASLANGQEEVSKGHDFHFK